MHYKKNKLSPLGFDPGFLVYKASGLTTEPELLYDAQVKKCCIHRIATITVGATLNILVIK